MRGFKCRWFRNSGIHSLWLAHVYQKAGPKHFCVQYVTTEGYLRAIDWHFSTQVRKIQLSIFRAKNLPNQITVSKPQLMTFLKHQS